MSYFQDISRVIAPGIAVYEGDDPLGESLVCDVGEDAPCRITTLQNWTTHFLTHVDAPRHFFTDGITLDEIPLDRFTGPALVIDIGLADEVTSDLLPAGDLEGMAVFFKTRNSDLDPSRFHENHAYVSKEAALELVSRKVNLVGIDYLSVDQFGDEEYPAHRTLLGNDVLVLEGLDLKSVSAGEYSFHAMPLRIAAADGSPVRAVLSSRV